MVRFRIVLTFRPYPDRTSRYIQISCQCDRCQRLIFLSSALQIDILPCFGVIKLSILGITGKVFTYGKVSYCTVNCGTCRSGSAEIRIAGKVQSRTLLQIDARAFSAFSAVIADNLSADHLHCRTLGHIYRTTVACSDGILQRRTGFDSQLTLSNVNNAAISVSTHTGNFTSFSVDNRTTVDDDT